MEYLQERTTAHLTQYAAVAKLCVRKLAQAFSDLGMNKDEQLQAFDRVATAAEQAWSDACEGVDVERQALRNRVDKDLAEVLKIREALGDDEADLELSQCQEEASSPRVTLRSLHERVQRRLEHWKGRRAERMVEYEAIMAVTCSLKSQLGQAQQVTRPDLSRANLDFLRMEQDKLRTEKEKRIRRLEAQLDQLAAQCQELGESSKAAMSEVHHSLWLFRESRQMGEVVAIDEALGTAASAPDMLLHGVELGDAMFERLSSKMDAVAELKAEREGHLQQLTAVLGSLWEALSVAPDAPERAAVSCQMIAPNKLHAETIEACGAEVSRLEQQQSRAMKDLVVAKAMELEQLCGASLMTAPDVTEMLMDMSQANRRESVGAQVQVQGQVSDVLSKMMRLIVEVRSEAAKRAGVVTQVKELEEAHQELQWLQRYEQDENRFKGRDAHSNLQRSLRAAKLRERVPPLVRNLQQAAQAWRLREGSPFLVHGRDYAEEVLPELSKLLEQTLSEKATTTKAKPAGSASKAGAGPPRDHAIPLKRTAAAHQHALTHQGLAERHSISVPLGGGMSATGPAQSAATRDAGAGSKLSRSTEFKTGVKEGGSAAAAEKSAPSSRRTSAQQQAPPPPPSTTKPATPVRPKAKVPPAASPLPQPQQGTPVKGMSSVDRAAAAAGSTPGMDPLQEKMARIMAGQMPGQMHASGGVASSARPGRRYPTTPTHASAAKPAMLVTLDDSRDVHSPRDTAKAQRAALTSPKAGAEAVAQVAWGDGASGAPQLAGGGGGGCKHVERVLPSPIKTSRIPKFNL